MNFFHSAAVSLALDFCVPILRKFIAITDKFNRLAGYAAAWAFVAIGFFVAYEVLMRKLGAPTIWTEEISQIVQIWSIYLGAAWVLQSRHMITVDIIGDRFSPRLRHWLDLFALCVIIAFSSVVLWQNIREVKFSLKLGVTTDTILAPPMWLIQISLSVGFSLLIVQALSEIFKNILAVRLEQNEC